MCIIGSCSGWSGGESVSTLLPKEFEVDFLLVGVFWMNLAKTEQGLSTESDVECGVIESHVQILPVSVEYSLMHFW